MSKFKIGDKVEVISDDKNGYYGNFIGKIGLINYINDDHEYPYSIDVISGYVFKAAELKLINNKNKIMKSIEKFVKELVLSADEKLLRKYGLKDDCGDWTEDAKGALAQKLLDDNQPYMVTIAQGLDTEVKAEKK